MINMSKVIKLSATRMSSFFRCRKKYWFSYVERMPKLSNPAFKLGIACHESLEFAGKILLEENKMEFSEKDKKAILDMYNKISVKEGIEEMAAHVEGRRLVEASINNFTTGRKIVGLETPFGFPNSPHSDLTTSQGVPLIGAIDKIVELDDETLLIIDYKTSKTAPTADQLKEDIQLSLYDLVAGILWPQYKRIVLCLDMLKSDPVYTYRTPQQREDFNDYLTEVHKQMSELKDEKDAKASLNVFCPWCDFKDYCDAYQKACNQTKYEFLPSSKLTDDQLIEEHKKISSTAKILDNRKRELNMLIMDKIQRNGADLMGEDEQMYIRQNARTNYDPREVSKLIPVDDLAGMVSLNKKAVDTYCSKNPTVAKRIKESATTNYTTPFLATKKIKK